MHTNESILFFGSLRNKGMLTGIYIGVHLFSLDWLIMLQIDTSQFALIRFQLLDRGLYEYHGQIIVFELNVLGCILSFRYTIPNFEPEFNNEK